MDSADAAAANRNVIVRDRLTTNLANPWMVIVDPRDETVLGQSGITLTNRVSHVIEFLNSVL